MSKCSFASWKVDVFTRLLHISWMMQAVSLFRHQTVAARTELAYVHEELFRFDSTFL